MSLGFLKFITNGTIKDINFKKTKLLTEMNLPLTSSKSIAQFMIEMYRRDFCSSRTTQRNNML